jgi:hypothetical protein
LKGSWIDSVLIKSKPLHLMFQNHNSTTLKNGNNSTAFVNPKCLSIGNESIDLKFWYDTNIKSAKNVTKKKLRWNFVMIKPLVHKATRPSPDVDPLYLVFLQDVKDRM